MPTNDWGIHVNRFDRELVRYFLAWLPFSGPDSDDVFAQFGMSRARAAEILLSVVAGGAETASDQRLLKELIDNIGQIRSFCIDTRTVR